MRDHASSPPAGSASIPVPPPESAATAADLNGTGRAAARVTQLDVARAAGVHNTTVSLALRNSPAIPPATRQRIQALAQQLGYRPDPALRALVAYRNGLGANHRTDTIAYVTNAPTRCGWRDHPRAWRNFQGAQQKASECGYQLEHFWLGEPDMSPRRLGDVLFNRGVSALILACGCEAAPQPLDFEWSRFSAVKIGLLPTTPPLHRITNDHGNDLRLAVQRALAAGCRRPGLVMARPEDDPVAPMWSMHFAMEQQRLAAAERIPVFVCRGTPGAVGGSAISTCASAHDTRFAQWFDRHQPDVLIGRQSTLDPLLSGHGLSTPRDVALVDPALAETSARIAGVLQSCEQVGRIAVEFLVSQTQQNLRGVPAHPTTTLVEGVWSPGPSLPERPRRSWDATRLKPEASAA